MGLAVLVETTDIRLIKADSPARKADWLAYDRGSKANAFATFGRRPLFHRPMSSYGGVVIITAIIIACLCSDL